MTRGHVYILAVLALSQLAFLQPGRKPVSAQDVVKWNVRIDVQMLAINKDDAPPLIWRLQDHRQTEGAAEELQTMLAHGRAELVAWPVTWAADRWRAIAETYQEVRYAKAPSWPAGVDEARFVGTTLEFVPAVHEDGLSVDLAIVPQWVGFVGFRAQRLGRTAGGLEMFGEQPQFNFHKVTTSLTVRSGQRRLIGVFYGAAPHDKVTFFILRAVILPVDRAPSPK